MGQGLRAGREGQVGPLSSVKCTPFFSLDRTRESHGVPAGLGDTGPPAPAIPRPATRGQHHPGRGSSGQSRQGGEMALTPASQVKRQSPRGSPTPLPPGTVQSEGEPGTPAVQAPARGTAGRRRAPRGLAGGDGGPAAQAQEHLLAVVQQPAVAELLERARRLGQHAHALPGRRQEAGRQVAGRQQQGLGALPPRRPWLQLRRRACAHAASGAARPGRVPPAFSSGARGPSAPWSADPVEHRLGGSRAQSPVPQRTVPPPRSHQVTSAEPLGLPLTQPPSASINPAGALPTQAGRRKLGQPPPLQGQPLLTSFAAGACPPPQTAVQELVCPCGAGPCHQPGRGFMEEHLGRSGGSGQVPALPLHLLPPVPIVR